MIKESGMQTVFYQDVFIDLTFTIRSRKRVEINRTASLQTLYRLRKIVKKLLPHATLQSFQCSNGDKMVHPRYV